MADFGKRNFREFDSRDPGLLDNRFHDRFMGMIDRLKAETGVEMVPYSMRRGLAEQCRLYRQSRTREQINKAIVKLKSRGMPYTAYVLDEVGPQYGSYGKHVTWTITNSFHLYGMAVDSYWKLRGRAVWNLRVDPAMGVNGYKEMRRLASEMGLFFLRGDYPHIQNLPGSYRESRRITYRDLDRELYELNRATNDPYEKFV